MDFKSAKRMELFSQYAVAASKEAMADAGIEVEIRQVPNDKKINAVNAL